MTYESSAGRYENPFLLSSLPAFLRGSIAMVVEAILFGCGYAALGKYGRKRRGLSLISLRKSSGSTPWLPGVRRRRICNREAKFSRTGDETNLD